MCYLENQLPEWRVSSDSRSNVKEGRVIKIIAGAGKSGFRD
jgi:hypothetical protein